MRTIPFMTARSVAMVVVAVGLLMSAAARAAQLNGPIGGWASGVPDDVSMYEYVPDELAAKPPILVVAHYCGGSAGGMFGLVSGSGLVSAADEYGFIMLFPETSQGCWDVSSTKTLTRDGGGDTHAIAEMVSYAIAKHGANPDRVYATGQSSGAMMTQALLALYPDVFKAGAEFSGVPAGCANIWDGQGLCGEAPQTAQQWGDRARAMYPGYTGSRPRIQLWHGTKDDLISYNNHTEAIKQWSNVLGLGASPTSMETITFNGHLWYRESWQDSCGYTVLDAWSEQDGPHNTNASENATHVIPFLGLDNTAATDPRLEQCGSIGDGGSGGKTDCNADAQHAYQGNASTIPGTVEAEDFDVAGYSDSTPANEGGAYRSDVGVDIKSLGDGYAVGWMVSGEWLEYTVDVQTAGDYSLLVRLGAVDAGRTLDFEVCGGPTVTVDVPQLSGWEEVTTSQTYAMHLEAGLQVIRVKVGAQNWPDFDSFRLDAIAPPTNDSGGGARPTAGAAGGASAAAAGEGSASPTADANAPADEQEPISNGNCGCRTAGVGAHPGLIGLAIGLGAALLGMRRRRCGARPARKVSRYVLLGNV